MDILFVLLLAVIPCVVSLITLGLIVLVRRSISRLKESLATIHLEINSRMDKFVEQTQTEYFARGEKAERDRGT